MTEDIYEHAAHIVVITLIVIIMMSITLTILIHNVFTYHDRKYRVCTGDVWLWVGFALGLSNSFFEIATLQVMVIVIEMVIVVIMTDYD